MLFILLIILCLAFGFTLWKSRELEAEHPPGDRSTVISGARMNVVQMPAVPATGPLSGNLPPIVFLHGASGNLRDQEAAFSGQLAGRAELLFVDRPGHGYSERGGPENDLPEGQADTLAALMTARGIDRAIICGHSFGGAIAAAFALRHPDRTAGLLLLSPATHPWNGGVDWYYHVAARPWIGWLFTRLFTLPVGLMLMEKATHAVFHPNRRPRGYTRHAERRLSCGPTISAATPSTC